MASCESAIDDLDAAMVGRPATIATFDEAGEPIDTIEGQSIQIRRESEFDSTDSDGFNIPDSEVLRISIGDNIIRHVGSSMVTAEVGVNQVAEAPTKLELQNTEDGRPWLNNIFETASNEWSGSAKTLMIRSQDGHPIGVYAGDRVEVYSTDIPKTTRFQIDGKYLFVYRVDYTVYDTELL
jgi:hypothetical protein